MSQKPPHRDSAIFRRWAAFAARHAPVWFLKTVPSLFGVAFALSLPGARRSVLANLRLIRGRQSWFRDAREVASTFANFASALTQSLAPHRAIYRGRKFTLRGKHHVEPLREEKRGAIFVTAHVGCWDSSAMGLSTFTDAPVMMLMAQEGDAEAGAVQDRLRLDASVRVLRVGASSLDALPALAHLQEGGIVVAQLDRVLPGRDAVMAPLFGRPFPVPRGLFQLAAIAKVPIVPVFSARLGFSRRLVEVAAPIFVPRKPSEKELKKCAATALKRLESHLRDYPTQWFHFSSEETRAVARKAKPQRPTKSLADRIRP